MTTVRKELRDKLWLTIKPILSINHILYYLKFANQTCNQKILDEKYKWLIYMTTEQEKVIYEMAIYGVLEGYQKMQTGSQ